MYKRTSSKNLDLNTGPQAVPARELIGRKETTPVRDIGTDVCNSYILHPQKQLNVLISGESVDMGPKLPLT